MAIISTMTRTSDSPSRNSFAIGSRKPAQDCTSTFCPIKGPHDCGVYMDSNRITLSTESRRTFAPNVTPPDVFAACERCMRNEGTKTDVELWLTSHELHGGPLLGHTDTVLGAPVSARLRSDDLNIVERKDLKGVEDHGATVDCGHPFGLRNPPWKVWEAHRRLRLGKEDLEDQELVESFAARNAYYGNGLGEKEIMSRRFNIRRPGYCPKST